MDFTEAFFASLGRLRALSTGSPTVAVALLDGVVDVRHPTLARAHFLLVLPGGEGAPIGGSARHGTHVASIIFGDGRVSGIAPRCRGLIAPIFFDGPDGKLRFGTQQNLALAIASAAEAGADIINISAGRLAGAADADGYLIDAIGAAVRRDVLIVAAAGNDGCDCHHLPAVLDGVMAVGALDAGGNPAAFSNWGSGYAGKAIFVPGQHVPGAGPAGSVVPASGTSQAAAIASGVAAVALSVLRDRGERVGAAAIRDLLLDTVAPVAGGAREGRPPPGGILDVERLMSRLADRALHPGSASSRVRSHDRSRGGITMLESVTSAPQEAFLAPQMMEHAVAEPLAREWPASEPTGAAISFAPAPLGPQGCSCGGHGGKGQEGGCGTGAKAEDCGCAKSRAPQKVYAIGTLWYDFGTEARRDALAQVMAANDAGVPEDPRALLTFLKNNPHFETGVTFTLNQDATPIYAVQPAGPFAREAYAALLEAVESSMQADEEDVPEIGSLQRVSVPGLIVGRTQLSNHMDIPVLWPDLRGMYRWAPKDLVAAIKIKTVLPDDDSSAPDEDLLNFLNRVYYELRNLGVSGEERAMNFAATNAYQAAKVFEDAASRKLVLDGIGVRKSPICRPDSECWDVEIRMFDPENDRRPARIYRFTVDVSEVLPVSVGPVRSWFTRL